MSAKFTKKWNSKKWSKGTFSTKRTGFKSPFATSFISGTKKGLPCGMIVGNIAKKTGKTTTVIFKSLTKAGLCKGQKVNGQWIYWPSFTTRTSKTNATTCKVKMWQNFADWCISSGTCTPKQFNTKSTSTKTFSAFFKSGFGKTITGATSTTRKTRKSRKTRKTTTRRTTTARHRHTTKTRTWTGRKTTWTLNTKRNKKRNTWNRTGYTTKVYKFPAYYTRTNTNWRRFARAA